MISMVSPTEKLAEDIKFWEQEEAEVKARLDQIQKILVANRELLKGIDGTKTTAPVTSTTTGARPPRDRFPSKKDLSEQLLYLAHTRPDFTYREFIEAQRAAHAKVRTRQTIDFHLDRLLVPGGPLEKIAAPPGRRGAKVAYRLRQIQETEPQPGKG